MIRNKNHYNYNFGNWCRKSSTTIVALVISGIIARKWRIPLLILCVLILSIKRFLDLQCPQWLYPACVYCPLWQEESVIEGILRHCTSVGIRRRMLITEGNETTEDPSKVDYSMWFKATGIKVWGLAGVFGWLGKTYNNLCFSHTMTWRIADQSL